MARVWGCATAGAAHWQHTIEEGSSVFEMSFLVTMNEDGADDRGAPFSSSIGKRVQCTVNNYGITYSNKFTFIHMN
jgi:hypothetical protein